MSLLAYSFVCSCVCSLDRLFVRFLSVRLLVHPSICSFIHPSVQSFVRQFVRPFVRPFMRSPVCTSVRLSVYNIQVFTKAQPKERVRRFVGMVERTSRNIDYSTCNTQFNPLSYISSPLD